ncbi:SLAC1 anion channel family protein [Halochromatium glycolicum]|uniref:C4-dicarboxylate ABC transporter n=1 Tax=Halochromatium glycolicum TaxID=85075 RepID=A0AAJ0X8Z9_9GAMM|nr:SLAC1 anion channel family protein [Halochromatium glycolicum]MBK1703713.1 C4-dicarboxylate ABC transporter [Halochromatium glycolicum]
MSTMQSALRLRHFPASFFAMVMGLAGLTISWEKAQQILQLELGLVPWLLAFTAAVFVLIALLYGAKLVLHRDAVLEELRHPVRLNFFPTLSISLLLLSIALLSSRPQLSLVLWAVGAATQLALTLYIVGDWMHGTRFQVHHLNPSWFIPAVGNVLVPIAGVPLGFVDLSWFYFSAGFLLWSVLMISVFYRVLFHHPLEARLMPTLFILIAPPAVGFIAYSRLVDELDVFAHALYFAALFLTLLLLVQAPRFLRLRFYLSWWAYSFPLAAVSIAMMVMYERTGTVLHRDLAIGLLMMLSGIVLLLLVSTVTAVLQRRICVPEQ